MKIDMLYNFQLEGHGAGTTHTMELFENLKKIGNEVVLFVPKSKHAISSKQYNILYLPILRRGSLLRDTFYQFVLFFYYLLYQTKHTKPDIIYSRISLHTISPLILSKLLKIPYVVEINGLGINELKLSNASKLIIQLHKLNGKFNYKHAKKIVAVTQGISEGIKELYNIPDEKIVVIENGVNTDLFRPISKGDVKYGLDEDYYIGFSGSFARWHGLEDLVKSAPLILKEVENTKFILVGNGERKEQIVQMVNDLNLTDNFIFVNRVPYEEVPKYLNIFDVCVILKKKNIPGCPLKLHEYMACGKPVIATNTQDFKALEEYNAGILVDPEKPEEVADAIITLLKNKELREELGKNGRKYVVENRSWEAVARELEKVMKEAIK
jgi:glycosyltransferase involved in cell wall biosynthesis